MKSMDRITFNPKQCGGRPCPPLHDQERSRQLPSSDVLLPLTKALGISLEELLGQQKPRRSTPPAGKVGAVFEAVSKLPRRQQQKILEVVQALLSQHSSGTTHKAA